MSQRPVGELARQIHSICTELLYSRFDTLEEFIEAWPVDAPDHPLLARIYSDCESAAEHTPASFFSRAINWRAWRRSGLYDLLELDRLVLKCVSGGQSLDDAALCRSYALDQVRANNRTPDWGMLSDECMTKLGLSVISRSGEDDFAIERATEVCELVQAGALMLKEFFALVRPEASPVLHAFLDDVYENLETAVEHTPGWLLRKGVNHEQWRRQWEYHGIELDKLLLDYLASGGSPAKAIAAREAIEPRLLAGGADTTYISQLVSSALPAE